MANTIQIKHGSSVPTTSNLAPFELGYVKDGALYINNDGTIQQLTGLAASGLVNSFIYLKLPAIAAPIEFQLLTLVEQFIIKLQPIFLVKYKLYLQLVVRLLDLLLQMEQLQLAQIIMEQLILMMQEKSE